MNAVCHPYVPEVKLQGLMQYNNKCQNQMASVWVIHVLIEVYFLTNLEQNNNNNFRNVD